MYLGTLSGKTAYDGIATVKGMKYKIWFSTRIQPAGVWTGQTVADRKTTYRYMANWNNKYGGRFKITKEPVVNATGDTIYMEGEGMSNSETFGRLGLDKAWVALQPFLRNIYLGIYNWSGVEGIQYYAIKDSSGNDVAAPGQGYVDPGLPPGSPGSPGGGSAPGGGATGAGASGGILGSSSIVIPVLIGTGLLVVVIGVAVLAKKRKKVA